MQTRWIFPAVLVTTLIGCSSSSDTVNEPEPPNTDDSLRVSDLFTDEHFSVIESLGLQMHPGNNPPNIEGTFRLDPRVFQASSVLTSADNIGNTVRSQDITFSNQDATLQTLEVTITTDDVDAEELGEVQFTESLITGSANAFNAIFLSTITFDGQTFDVAQTFSGTITDNGIENLQQIDTVIDDGGDPGNIINPSDSGDLFIDLDGFSERIN